MILEFKSDFDAKKKSVLIYQLFDKICTFFVQFFISWHRLTFIKKQFSGNAGHKSETLW